MLGGFALAAFARYPERVLPGASLRPGSETRTSPSHSAPPPSQGVTPAPSRFTLPLHAYQRVPFSSQAPFGDWLQPFADACEEASVAMAMAWVRGETELPPERAREEILGQVAYERYYFGHHQDTALRETAKLFTRYYGYERIRLTYDIAPEDITRELSRGNLVIVPAAGRILANPYYISPPPYHMIVLVGYDEVAREFIVHDPGTKRGESWRYPYATLWEAIHDWTGSEETLFDGRKGMIVVMPPDGS